MINYSILQKWILKKKTLLLAALLFTMPVNSFAMTLPGTSFPSASDGEHRAYPGASRANVIEAIENIEADLTNWKGGQDFQIQDVDSTYQLVYYALTIGERMSESKVDKKTLNRKLEVLAEQYLSWVDDEIQARKLSGKYKKEDMRILSTRVFVEVIRLSTESAVDTDYWRQQAINQFAEKIKDSASRKAKGTEMMMALIAVSSFPVLWLDMQFGLLSQTKISAEMVLAAAVVTYSSLAIGYYGERIFSAFTSNENKRNQALKEVLEITETPVTASHCRILFTR